MDDHANLTDQSVQNSSQVPEDHADVVTATAEHGEERVALGSFQGASPQSTVGFHVPDHRLNCTAPSQEFGNRHGDTTLRAVDENLHIFHAMATVSAIDKGHLGPLVCEGLDLFQRLGQRVAIIGIARQRPYPDHKAAPVGRSHADLGAELVALVHLALGNTVHRRFMLVQLPLDVAQHPTSVALEPAQHLAHPFELAGMGVAPNLTGQTRGKAAIALPQADPGLSGQPDLFAPCRIKQPGIRWMGNVFFHHRGIDGGLLEVAVLHCTGSLPGFNRFGPQPLDTPAQRQHLGDQKVAHE